MSKESLIKKANSVVPSKAQLDFMNTEFIGFIHYGMNTFCNTESGTGREPEKYFTPADFNPKQWIDTVCATGMKGVVLTCKCSDGFCLWPSKHTKHSVKSSPWRDGNGDIVREIADECALHNIKFGISLSPYDMHEITFGTSEYNNFFVNQLTELCTEYGEIFCVWLDRDNSGRQDYDWQRYYDTIKKYQPNAMICNCGPDIRWCGNHVGVGRSSEWSVVPKKLINNAPVSALVEPDLGSRSKIKKADELVWFPMVMDLTMRPGWFYHESDNPDLKLLSKALETYFKSVGNNGTLMLNIAPSHSGYIDKKDVQQFVTLGSQLRLEFKENFAQNAVFEASNCSDELHSVKFINSDKSYYKTIDNPRKTEITVDLGEVRNINKILLAEHIETGQQIEKFKLYFFYNKKWRKIYSGDTVGRKKICLLKEMDARRIKLVIEKTRGFATIEKFKIY